MHLPAAPALSLSPEREDSSEAEGRERGGRQRQGRSNASSVPQPPTHAHTPDAAAAAAVPLAEELQREVEKVGEGGGGREGEKEGESEGDKGGEGEGEKEGVVLRESLTEAESCVEVPAVPGTGGTTTSGGALTSCVEVQAEPAGKMEAFIEGYAEKVQHTYVDVEFKEDLLDTNTELPAPDGGREGSKPESDDRETERGEEAAAVEAEAEEQEQEQEQALVNKLAEEEGAEAEEVGM